MSNFLAFIAERVINQPLLILPEKLAVIALVLEGRLNLDASELKNGGKIKVGDAEVDLASPLPEASRYIGERRLINPNDPKAGYKPYRMTSEGAAVIPAHGSLVNRGGFLDALSGVTSYEGLKHQLAAASSDQDVGSILLHIDSGGGEAVGAFGAADAVRAATRFKPVYAVTDGICCSAAYALASGATRVIVARDSIVGSIGAAMLHLDHSKLLADAGVKPTLFVTGRKKQQGHPFFELTDEVRADLRDHINRINAQFVSTVSSHRGLSPEKILALEAGVFIGAEAIAHGLVDEVGTVEGALSELHSRTRRPQKGPRMDKTYTQAEYDQAVTAARTEGHKAGAAEGQAAGQKEGVTAERARFKAVQTAETFKGRETSALHMLHTTDLSAEAINGVLAGIEVPKAAEPPKPQPTGERAKDQTDGVVIEGAQGDKDGGKQTVPKTDFEKGKELAQSLPASMRRTA